MSSGGISWAAVDDVMLEAIPASIAGSASRPFVLWVKRAMDVVLALVGLVALSPVFLAIAIAIKLTSRGPVLYVQPRLGRDFEVFNLIKFRTMVDGAHERAGDYAHLNEASGPFFKIRDDPRLTPLGRRLRRHFLDELPQLWNVLVGEMSLVGPRPVLAEELDYAPDPTWLPRFSVTQGITGPWQTNGHHGISFEEQVRVELDYIAHWSLARDLAILVRTVPLVLLRHGV